MVASKHGHITASSTTIRAPAKKIQSLKRGKYVAASVEMVKEQAKNKVLKVLKGKACLPRCHSCRCRSWDLLCLPVLQVPFAP